MPGPLAFPNVRAIAMAVVGGVDHHLGVGVVFRLPDPFLDSLDPRWLAEARIPSAGAGTNARGMIEALETIIHPHS